MCHPRLTAGLLTNSHRCNTPLRSPDQTEGGPAQSEALRYASFATPLTAELRSDVMKGAAQFE